MKSKTPLALMELVIMLLAFSLAAALCLQAFYWADSTSNHYVLADEAIMQVQSVAELAKHYSGDLQSAAAACGGIWDGSVWTISYERFQIQVIPQDASHPLLGTADIRAATESGDALAELTVCWQEVTKNG